MFIWYGQVLAIVYYVFIIELSIYSTLRTAFGWVAITAITPASFAIRIQAVTDIKSAVSYISIFIIWRIFSIVNSFFLSSPLWSVRVGRTVVGFSDLSLWALTQTSYTHIFKLYSLFVFTPNNYKIYVEWYHELFRNRQLIVDSTIAVIGWPFIPLYITADCNG